MEPINPISRSADRDRQYDIILNALNNAVNQMNRLDRPQEEQKTHWCHDCQVPVKTEIVDQDVKCKPYTFDLYFQVRDAKEFSQKSWKVLRPKTSLVTLPFRPSCKAIICQLKATRSIFRLKLTKTRSCVATRTSNQYRTYSTWLCRGSGPTTLSSEMQLLSELR